MKIKEKMKQIEEAVTAWRFDELSDFAALTAIGLIVTEQKDITPEMEKWAMESLARIHEKKEKEKKMSNYIFDIF